MTRDIGTIRENLCEAAKTYIRKADALRLGPKYFEGCPTTVLGARVIYCPTQEQTYLFSKCNQGVTI